MFEEAWLADTFGPIEHLERFPEPWFVEALSEPSYRTAAVGVRDASRAAGGADAGAKEREDLA